MTIEKTEESKVKITYESNFLKITSSDRQLLKVAQRVKNGKISMGALQTILQKKVKVTSKEPITGDLWEESFNEIYSAILNDYGIVIEQQSLDLGKITDGVEKVGEPELLSVDDLDEATEVTTDEEGNLI